MRVKLVDSKPHQSLIEYVVGGAGESCVYPGIAQCFAIAGWMQNEMPSVHVSPGFTEEEMTAAFEHLKTLGGDSVLHWYIIGPIRDHFSTSTALWKSVKDIKKTFTKHLKNKAATYLVLDATDERSQTNIDPGMTIPYRWNGIDVRVEKRGITLAFSYRETKRAVTPWREFDLTKFTRF